MPDKKKQPADSQGAGNGSPLKVKLIAASVVVLAAAIGYWQFGYLLSLETLAAKEAALRQYQQQHPVIVFGICFLVYVLVTGLSLPGAAAMSLAFAWLLGFFPALILVSFASTTGATCAFLMSRFFFYDAVQRRFGDRLTKFNAALEREGAFYLFTLRLIVGVPFFVINLVMGLTPIRTWTFWWVSQLGMLPGTAVYVWAGSSLPSLSDVAERGVSGIFTVELAVAFLALGLLPLILKKVVSAVRDRRSPHPHPGTPAEGD